MIRSFSSGTVHPGEAGAGVPRNPLSLSCGRPHLLVSATPSCGNSGGGSRIQARVRGRRQTALAVVLGITLALVLIAPSYDLLPTTLHDTSPAATAVPVALHAVPLVLSALVAVLPGPGVTGACAELLAANCIRLC